MVASIIGFIVKYLADDVVAAIFNLISAELTKRGLIQQGIATQAAAETASTAHINAAEAQSEAQTDRTAQGMEEAARSGKF